MDIILLVARLILAGTFLLAGIGKLADLAGSRQAVQNFGVPARFASLAGLALPIGELVVAVALIPVATSWWGALGALLLLIMFLAAIGYNIAHGRTPDCHCFGQIHSAPAGPRTMVRNGILAALAASIVALGFSDRHPGSSAISWFGDLTGAGQIRVVFGALIVIAVSVMGWMLAQVILQNGRLLVRLDALEEMIVSGKPAPITPESAVRTSMPAPAFSLPNLNGDLVSLDSLRSLGKPTLLVFSDPNCHACNLLLPSLATWQSDGRFNVAMISRGTPAANHAKVATHGLSNVLLQKDREIALAYGADVTPTAVVILPNGVIESPVARGVEDIKALVARTLPPASGLAIRQPSERSERTVPTVVGMPAPTLSLPDLDGNPVSLDQFRGAETLVLFWNPDCGYCQRLLPQVHAWEAKPPAHAPQLLVVSQGTPEANRALNFRTPEANRALNFRAPVLLSDGGAGAPFGIHGTPAAILIDANGLVASPAAIGMTGVLGRLNPASSCSPAPASLLNMMNFLPGATIAS